MSMTTLSDSMPSVAMTPRPSNTASRTIALLMATMVAVGCGATLGYAISQTFLPPAPPTDANATKVPELNQTYTYNAITVPAKPMVTNLGTPSATWIRIEGSFVMTGLERLAAERLAAEVQQDMLGYLRGVQLAQVEGASGLLHLREDLNEIARARSSGHVTEFILETMVVQ